MSIEYRATCTPDDAWIDTLSAWMSRDARFVVLARHPKRVSLRIAKYPLRGTWPEDIEIQLDDAGVYVAFHGVTATERNDFLDIAREALARSGCVAVFEEL